MSRDPMFLMRQARAAYESGEPAKATAFLDTLEQILLEEETVIPGSKSRALRELNTVRDTLGKMLQ